MPAIETFNINYGFSIGFQKDGAQINLAASTELTYTVPGDRGKLYTVLFGYNPGARVWVDKNNTVVLPVAGTVVSNSTAVINPSQRYANGGDVLHFISADASTDVMVALYDTK